MNNIKLTKWGGDFTEGCPKGRVNMDTEAEREIYQGCGIVLGFSSSEKACLNSWLGKQPSDQFLTVTTLFHPFYYRKGRCTSSLRSIPLSWVWRFPESHTAFLFPFLFPFSLPSMKLVAARPLCPADASVEAHSVPSAERRCSQRSDTCRWTLPLGGAAGGWSRQGPPPTAHPQRRRLHPGRSHFRHLCLPAPASWNVTWVLTVLPMEWQGVKRPERPSVRDWRPRRQVLDAKPPAANGPAGGRWGGVGGSAV